MDKTGNTTIVAVDKDGESSDDGGTVTLSASQTSFTSADLCSNKVTLTATDAASNADFCTATITVKDMIPPSIRCPVNIMQDNDAGACGSIVTFAATATGNYSTPSITYSKDPGTLLPVGPTTVTVIATDPSGNTAECTLTVTVNDTEKPEEVCKDTILYLDVVGKASITAHDVDGRSRDNCEIETKSIDVSTFNCADVGTPVTVTLTVTDPSGNHDDCEATVTVLDTVSPVVLCKNITIQLVVVGQASIDATDLYNGSWDACGIAS